MNKFKKIILHPKQFVKDSMWFRQNNLELNKEYKNVFVISHLGQLNQVESLIQYENIKNCLLVILYTKKNTKVPKSIQMQYNKNLFNDSILFLLPNSPNNYNMKSLVFMRRNYQKLIDIAKPKNLYVLSFENHYSLLLDITKKFTINTILIDEGTATYKTPELSEYMKVLPLYKKIFAYILNVNQALQWTTQFNAVYGAFPELLKDRFQSNSYNRFFAHAGENKSNQKTIDLIKNYKITENDFIYVNQRYPIQGTDFTDAILNILNKISRFYNSKVFIKMHPKDTDNLKKEFAERLQVNRNIILIEESEFLIEPAIRIVKPRGVIGLTSTSLVYTPFVSATTVPYSIKPWFISLLNTQGNESGIKIINDHYTILKQFKHVLVLNNKSDLQKYIDNKTQNKTQNKNKYYLNIAIEAFNDQNHYKAIINYQWAYPNGIENMPIDDFIMYLDSVYNKNGFNATKDTFHTWIENKILLNESKRLKEYEQLVNNLSKYISESIEYNIATKSVYDDIYALLTSKLSRDTFPLNLIDTISLIRDESEKDFLPLLEIEARRNFIKLDYEKSLNILNNIFKYDEYISNNDNLYILLSENLIVLNKEKEILSLHNKIKELDIRDEVKLLSHVLFLSYTQKYQEALDLLIDTIDEFSDSDKEELKPELLLAKLYRLLNNYDDAKKYLISFERHSKGNLLCHKEIAYLEYSFNNHAKAIAQFKRAYPNGIENMPIDDFIMYLDSICIANSSDDYIPMYKLLKENNIKNNIKIRYYYLILLSRLELFNEFNKEIDSFNFNKLNIDEKEKINLLWLEALRKEGKINNSLNIIDEIKTSVQDLDIKYLIYKAEVYELTNNFLKANIIWKDILTYHSSDQFCWNRYYQTLSSMGESKT